MAVFDNNVTKNTLFDTNKKYKYKNVVEIIIYKSHERKKSVWNFTFTFALQRRSAGLGYDV